MLQLRAGFAQFFARFYSARPTLLLKAILIAGTILPFFSLFSFSARIASAAPPDGAVQKLPIVDKQDIRFIGLSIGGKPFQKRVLALAQDNYGFIWLGTDDGLYRYDGNSLRHYSHDPGNPGSLSDNTVLYIYKDRAGILWIGTGYGGLDRLDPAGTTFRHYRHDPKDGRSLRADFLTGIYEDQTRALWVDTDDGFDRLDAASGHFIHYSDPGEEIPRRHPSRGFYEDFQGNLLVGYPLGLYKLDRTGGGLSRLWNTPVDSRRSANQDLRWLASDRTDTAWFTSQSENILGSFDKRTGQMRRYAFAGDGSGTRNSVEVFRVHEDRNGSLWIGTRSGLFKLDKDRKNFVRYPEQPDAGMSGLIWAILEDSEGNCGWAASRGSAGLRPGRARL